MSEKTAALNIYKKSAAAQISMIFPTRHPDGYIEKTGGVLIECALPAGKDSNGNTTYDWKNKIAFSLGPNDLALLFEDFSKKLIHDYKGTLKEMVLLPGEGEWEGTFRMAISSKESDGTKKNVLVPMTAGETKVFTILLQAAVPRILGW